MKADKWGEFGAKTGEGESDRKNLLVLCLWK